MYGGEMMNVHRVLLSGIFEGIKPQCNRTGRPLSNARASPKTPHYQSERILFAPVAMPPQQCDAKRQFAHQSHSFHQSLRSICFENRLKPAIRVFLKPADTRGEIVENPCPCETRHILPSHQSRRQTTRGIYRFDKFRPMSLDSINPRIAIGNQAFCVEMTIGVHRQNQG